MNGTAYPARASGGRVVPGACETGMFRPQPPWMGSRRSGNDPPPGSPCLRSHGTFMNRGLCTERIHDDVDREFCDVFSQPALVAPVEIPLAAVVLVAVEHAEPAVDRDSAQVVVHEIVAPAVQLHGGRRRSVEGEEAAVDRVVLG